MPRGKYIRKPKTHTAPPAVERPKALITPAAAIAAFSTQLGSLHRQSLVVACSAAVCFIVGVHAAEPMEQDELINRIKKVTGRLGLGDAQVAKYTGIAKALVQHIMHRFKLAGPIAEVIAAETPEKATDALAAYLTKQKVTTLEGLTVMFGKYKRTRARARPVVTAAVTRPITAAPAGGEAAALAAITAPGVQPELSEELAQAAGDQSLAIRLRTLPTEFVIRLAVQAGHSLTAIATTAIKLITSTVDMDAVLEVLVDHRKQLALVAAGAVAEQAVRREQMANG